MGRGLPNCPSTARNNGLMGALGRPLIVLGLVLVIVGIVITFGDRLPIRLGRLPGDFVYRGRNTTFYFPIVTCVLLSVVLSLLMWLFGRSR
jgi:hypothetical protein